MRTRHLSGLAAQALSVAAGTILWDGRFNEMTSSSDLEKWSFSNEVGSYQYYIHGSSKVSSYVNLGTGFKNPADSGSTQGAQITLDDTAHWEGSTSMRRTELIPQTSAAITRGTLYYHFSLMKSDINPVSETAEHQIAFFESHFTEMKAGLISGESGASDALLRWDVGSVTQWNVTWNAGEWHNMAYEINFDAKTVAFWHSTGADALTRAVAPMSASVSSNGADWHIGMLELVKSTSRLFTEDLFFSGVYIESGDMTTSVSGPVSSSSGSVKSSTSSAAKAASSRTNNVPGNNTLVTSTASALQVSNKTLAAPAGGSKSYSAGDDDDDLCDETDSMPLSTLASSAANATGADDDDECPAEEETVASTTNLEKSAATHSFHSSLGSSGKSSDSESAGSRLPGSSSDSGKGSESSGSQSPGSGSHSSAYGSESAGLNLPESSSNSGKGSESSGSQSPGSGSHSSAYGSESAGSNLPESSSNSGKGSESSGSQSPGSGSHSSAYGSESAGSNLPGSSSDSGKGSESSGSQSPGSGSHSSASCACPQPTVHFTPLVSTVYITATAGSVTRSAAPIYPSVSPPLSAAKMPPSSSGDGAGQGAGDGAGDEDACDEDEPMISSSAHPSTATSALDDGDDDTCDPDETQSSTKSSKPQSSSSGDGESFCDEDE